MFLLRGEWVNKVCVSAGAKREREHVHVCIKMPASLLFFCVGCKPGGFKCTKGMCAGNCSTLTIVGSVVERKSVRVLTLAPSKGLI